MIRSPLVIEVPDPGDKRLMSSAFCQRYRLMLCSKRGKHMISMVFDNIIIDP